MNAGNFVADALDRGEIPWRFFTFPRNILSGKPCYGTAPILLNIAAASKRHVSPWWGTAIHWAVFDSHVAPKSGIDIPDFDEPFFNWEVTDRSYCPPALRHEDPDAVFDAIVKLAGVRLVFNAGSDCRWIGGPDEHITIPHKWMFELGPGKVEAYWDALGHELFHFSESRVGWKADYDVSELRAEIGTGYLGALVGAKPLPINLAGHHRTYQARWSASLRADPMLLDRVCENVCRTVIWMHKIAGRKVE